MAQDVQRLLLQIDANATLLRQELVKASSSIDGFASGAESKLARVDKSMLSLSNVTGIAMKGFAGLAGVLAGVSLVGLARQALAFADDLATAADQAGIASERYQTLKEGLRALEVSGEQADKIFRKLFSTLGEVQGGTAGKGITEAFDRMGITAKVLNGEIDTTDELLDAIAASARNYATEAQYVADVSAIVGQKMGPQLAAALRDGGLALREQEQAFRDAGAVISDEYLKKLADANETIDAWTSRTKSTFTIWAAEVIGAFETLGNVIDRITGKFDTSTAAGTRAALEKARATRISLERGTFGILPASPLDIQNARKQEERLTVQLAGQMFPLNNRGTLGAVDAPRPTPAAKKGKAAGKTATPKTTKAGPQEFTLASMESGWALRQLSDAGTPANIEMSNQALRSVADTMDDLASYDFQINPIGQEQIALAEDYTRTLTEGLAQAVVYGRNFGDVLKGLAQQIAASGLINILSGGKFGTSFGDALGGLGKIFGGKRETGGPVQKGKSYIVGEKRPELFVPKQDGFILPRVPAEFGKSDDEEPRLAALREQLQSLRLPAAPGTNRAAPSMQRDETPEQQATARLMKELKAKFGGFRETGGPVQKGKSYIVGEKRPELFVPKQDGFVMPRVPAEFGKGDETPEQQATARLMKELKAKFGGFRETGGSVMPGKAYVVGEKRPEVFVPSTAGYIMPRVPTGQGEGGQQSVSVTVNPSPLFITTVTQGAQMAAQETLRKTTRQRMPQSAGV